MSERSELAGLVDRIMNSMPNPPEGGIAVWVDAVKAHDGQLDRYASALLDEALVSIVSSKLRNKRDPMTQGRLFHSVEVEVGRDADGDPIRERHYIAAREVYRSVAKTNQVVDYYCGQSRAFAKEANRTVIAARTVNVRYARELPFPNLEDDGEVA